MVVAKIPPPDKRNRHRQVGCQPRSPVDHRGFFDFPGKVIHKTFQHPGGERQGDSDINRDQADVTVDQADIGKYDDKRYCNCGWREHTTGQNDQRGCLVAVSIAGDADGREQSDHHRKGSGHYRGQNGPRHGPIRRLTDATDPICPDRFGIEQRYEIDHRWLGRYPDGR